MTNRPGLDICNFNFDDENGQGNGYFDYDTLSYTFYTSDKQTFPPGVYVIQFDVTLNDETVNMFLEMTIIDPCPTTLIFALANQFPPEITYTLGSGPLSLPYDIDAFAVLSDDDVDCGPASIQFMVDGLPFDGDLFKIEESPFPSEIVVEIDQFDNPKAEY